MEMTWIWVAFNVFVLGMLALDLGVFHRKAHEVSIKEATIWSVVWIGLAMVFNVLIYYYWDVMNPVNPQGYSNDEAALLFLTGYLIEKSLSVDNVFVFALVFSSFAVPAIYQHRVLFWGVLGALIMRGIMIAAGAALINEFHWIIWIFGGFLIYTGIKMFKSDHGAVDPQNHTVVRWLRKIMPMTDGYEQDRFVVVKNGVRMATPLLAVLLVIEFTDLIFAVDSIPAIFAVTLDPFIVYTSNVFAILGLRSLYFVLAGAMGKFRYLKPALAFILVFVGIKMFYPDVMYWLTAEKEKFPPLVSLAIVTTTLLVAIVASWWRSRQEPTASAQH
jgi:tellurite resistance protein TerC